MFLRRYQELDRGAGDPRLDDPLTDPLTLDLTDHAALSRVQQLDAWKQLKFA